MTPDERTLLQSLGTLLLVDMAIHIALSFFYGFFTFLIAILISRRLTFRPTPALLSLSILSFTLLTLDWAASWVDLWILIRSVLVDDIGLPLDEKLASTNFKVYKAGIIATWAQAFLPVVDDMIIIRRGWALFPGQRRALLVMFLLWLATVATTFAQLSFITSFNEVQALASGGNKVAFNLNAASFSLSLATNIVATGCIAYGLWRHRRLVVSHLGQGTRVQKVLSLLVDTGVIYCVLQLITIILGLFASTPTSPFALVIAFSAFSASYAGFSAMYPLLVVFLAKGHRSFRETYNNLST